MRMFPSSLGLHTVPVAMGTMDGSDGCLSILSKVWGQAIEPVRQDPLWPSYGYLMYIMTMISQMMPAPWNWLHKLPIFSGCSKFKPCTSSISIGSLAKQVVDAWNSTYLLTRCVEHLRNLTRVLIGKKKQTLSEKFWIGGQMAVTTIYGCFFTCLSHLQWGTKPFKCLLKLDCFLNNSGTT